MIKRLSRRFFVWVEKQHATRQYVRIRKRARRSVVEFDREYGGEERCHLSVCRFALSARAPYPYNGGDAEKILDFAFRDVDILSLFSHIGIIALSFSF